MSRWFKNWERVRTERVNDKHQEMRAHTRGFPMSETREMSLYDKGAFVSVGTHV